MKGEVNKKRILFAKRMFFAESSMHQALSLAQYAMTSNLSENKDVFSPLMAGICVVYSRPFQGANGLGSLEERFEHFTDAKLQETHDDLIRNRHTFYAHRDLIKTRAKDPTTGAIVDMHSVILNFDGAGAYTFATREPLYRDINLPAIIELCTFQKERIAEERHKSVDKLNKGKILPRGSYEIGIDFPPPKRKKV